MLTFIEKDEYEFLVKSSRFCEQIDKYTDLLELDAIDVIDYKNDNDLFNYVFANADPYGSLAESFLKYKIYQMKLHFEDLVILCKSSKNYTAHIGHELGISTFQSSYDLDKHTPKVIMDFTCSGKPLLKWTKGIFDGVEIWKNRGDNKGYQKLSRAYNQEYIDVSPLPVGKHESWKYSIIYIYKGEMIGNWSDETEIIVQNYD